MKPSNRAAFTLLELVVVLAILAIVTALAVRSLDKVEDQRRSEAAQRGLEELEAAVLGSPDDRATDGSRTVSGFVADLGRLPKTVAETVAVGSASVDALTLRELWANPQPAVPYGLREASVANGVPAAAADAQVRVPGGWRGPYLRLPLGASTLLDGWGNAVISPQSGATPAARLLDAAAAPLNAAGQTIRSIRHLGADGVEGGAGYDEDLPLAFTDDKFTATLAGSVEVLDGNDPATIAPGDTIVVRAFGPDPADAAKIKVIETASLPFTSNPVLYSLSPASGELTIGPRVVRAYRYAGGVGTPARKSGVKTVTLRPGANQLDLTIDRL